jgi:hypothetical protein
MATVNELIDQVRQQTDESNVDYIPDDEIISALDRGQRAALNIVARKFPDMFYATSAITTVSGTYDYDIPRAAAGRRISHVEVEIGESTYPMNRIDLAKASNYKSSATTTRPVYFSISKNTVSLYPAPSGGLTVNLYYQRRSEPLVKQQGQITVIDDANNVVAIDAVGSSLTTSTTGFGCYVNFIDRVTGAVKGTCQLSAIDTDVKELTLKSSGLTRSSVLDKTVSTSLPTDLEVDDYVCLVTGTCVPELDEMYTDYVIQYAIVEIKRRFGESIQEEMIALNQLQNELEKMWAGRKQAGRVRKANSAWPIITRLFR